MKDIMLKHLIDFGLSDKEAKIYTTLLELEMATVFEIAKESGINRSSAYVVLEGLRKKGLVGISEDKKVRHYIAASPETLLQAAKENAKKQEGIKEGIELIIPELKALYKSTKHRPTVKVFEGGNAAREVYWSLFDSRLQGKELKTVANLPGILKQIPNFIDHDKERGKRGIKMYAINPATNEMLQLIAKGLQPTPPAEYLLIPPEKFKFSSDLGIIADKVSIVSPKGNFGIIVESKEISDLLNNIFDLAWQEAKRLNKEIVENLKNNNES